MKVNLIFRHFIYLLFTSLLFISCEDKEILIEVEDNKFPELGSDGPYIADQKYSGVNNYIEYYSGNLPLIIAAPHGGAMMPLEIPDRTAGTMATDKNTKELSKAVMNVLKSNFGSRPHVIINNLDRKKMDANREVNEATQGNVFAKRAWDEYHHYINSAKNKILEKYSYGLYLDIHGHGVNPDGFYDLRIWLGYLLSGNELDKTDDELNNGTYQSKSSINKLTEISSENFTQVLRGDNSFGNILDNLGYPCLPSINDPSPEGMRYFSGGYNTSKYGSAETGSKISSIQIELPLPDIRENSIQWNNFGEALSTTLEKYFKKHYNINNLGQ
ncbi:MAG: hypothetical protein HOJ63_01755 [Flavobacteriaceae bacterium]|nr:hypothetical protein [Flavobacteriaceae bacterium]MBT5595879.1 hypothetical protein [Flavobacteriaceae bacterium]MBT6688635.1 hypothetical protein [Flavobacteriaceae bacterium]MBT7554537.1 hypothetical protein [Flavobacteriaceae bacterium]